MSDKVYKNVLLASELSPVGEFVARKAVNIAKSSDANLSVVHAIQPIITYAPVYFTPEIQEDMMEEAREKLAAISEKFNIKKDHQFVVLGHPKEAILDLANEIKADLIVVGSHHHSWFSPLLGSTAHNIIAQAECDVLVIPVREMAKDHHHKKN